MSLTREEKNHWEKQIEESRFLDFNELKLWLKNKRVVFSPKTNGITLNGFFISNSLKVYFGGTKKGYQYNLGKIKERIIRDLCVSD